MGGAPSACCLSPVGAAASQTAADVYSQRGCGGHGEVVWGCGGLLSSLRGGGIDCTSASLSCGRLRREAAYLRRLDLYGDVYGASEQLFGFCFLSSRVVPNLLDVKIVLPACLKG